MIPKFCGVLKNLLLNYFSAFFDLFNLTNNWHMTKHHKFNILLFKLNQVL